MLKDKINYKLVNIAIIALIIFLIYQTGNLWMGVVSKTLKIITPFFIAFIVAYALHPFFKFLTNLNTVVFSPLKLKLKPSTFPSGSSYA